jgi:hypothetical protein
MRNLIILSLLFTTTLPDQFTLQFEQGITVSGDINYKPIGIGLVVCQT